MHLSSRVDNIVPSGIRVVMSLAAERAATGLPVLHMEVGEPNFPTPPHVIDAAFEAARAGQTGYTPNIGTPGLRDAVADRVRERTGAYVTRENVAITSGAVMALYLALMSTIEPGDEVLVPDPGWPNYQSAISLCQGVAVPYALDAARGYALDVPALERLVTTRTRMIVVNFPGNPTGATISAETMRALVAFARERGLYILSDEVYEDFSFDGEHASVLMDGADSNLILVSGTSKSYAMTGWRIGWMVGDAELVRAAAKLAEPLTSCPSSVSQAAAEAALRGPQDAVAQMRESYERAAGIVESILGPSGVLAMRPRGAFYALVDVSSSGLSSDEFTRRLLDERGVAVAPGGTFGARSDSLVRISTALEESELRQGCTVLRDFLRELSAAAPTAAALVGGSEDPR